MHKTEKWLFSPSLAGKSRSKKIAYIAVMTALCVLANTFFEFKFAQTQFSLTLVFSALTGILIGPTFGFAACFLGDLVGFLYHSSGYPYMPWIGLSMGVTAFLSGVLTGVWQPNCKGSLFLRLTAVCISSFLLCTVAINTTAFWILYAKGVPYGTYLVSRLFVQGQIWNSIFNYGLLFIAVPALTKVKAFGIIL
jgi:ECF transporter S component (folate family)